MRRVVPLLLLVLLLTRAALAGKSDLVDLAPGFRLDIRYATTNNFMKMKLYPEARAFLQRPVAEALTRVNSDLKKQGYELIILDAYRPWSVTRLIWDRAPAAWRTGGYVGDPARGSRHNRGATVDLTMASLKTGNPVLMPTQYDDFTAAAHANYQGGSWEARKNRDLLIRAMARHGFTVLPEEWWHFDHRDWPKYPVMDVPFNKVDAARSR